MAPVLPIKMGNFMCLDVEQRFEYFTNFVVEYATQFDHLIQPERDKATEQLETMGRSLINDRLYKIHRKEHLSALSCLKDLGYWSGDACYVADDVSPLNKSAIRDYSKKFTNEFKIYLKLEASVETTAVESKVTSKVEVDVGDASKVEAAAGDASKVEVAAGDASKVEVAAGDASMGEVAAEVDVVADIAMGVALKGEDAAECFWINEIKSQPESPENALVHLPEPLHDIRPDSPIYFSDDGDLMDEAEKSPQLKTQPNTPDGYRPLWDLEHDSD